MFWNVKPTINEDDEHWQLETWKWLLKNRGGIEKLKNQPPSFPSNIHFPPTEITGHAHALAVFDQVIERFGYNSEDFEIICQEQAVNPILGPLAIVKNAPADPSGTYALSDSEQHIVSYSPNLLDNLEGLIATFAHEICHPVLLSIPEEPPGGAELEEYATDLATIFYGFGVFGANSSFVFNQYSDNATGTQGWSVSRAGYLTPNEWGFGLAVRTILAEDNLELVTKFLNQSVALHFEKNLAYLQKNDDFINELIKIHP